MVTEKGPKSSFQLRFHFLAIYFCYFYWLEVSLLSAKGLKLKNQSQGRNNKDIFLLFWDLMEEYSMTTLLKPLNILAPITVLVQEDMEVSIKLH
ncbi:hypothetical protein Gotur_035767 [Gossypium turneri]